MIKNLLILIKKTLLQLIKELYCNCKQSQTIKKRSFFATLCSFEKSYFFRAILFDTNPSATHHYTSSAISQFTS